MGWPHELNLLKNNIRYLYFEELVQKLPCSGTDDGVLQSDLPTSLLQSFFVRACANNKFL